MCIPSAPKTQIAPPPAPPKEAPKSIDPVVKQARSDEVNALRANAGRNSTILTGSLGLDTQASTGKKQAFGA